MLESLLGIDFTTIAIILCVALVIIAMIKAPSFRPILIVILCLGWLGLGVYSGITLYTYEKTQSSVVGTPTVYDPYEDFEYYYYDVSDIVWYQDDEGNYYYTITYATSLDFNGTENSYNLLVNNTPCTNTISTYGRLYGLYQKQFKDLDGEIIATINFEINFTFSSSNITLTITTDATSATIGIVREYVNINGFELRIINQVYNSGS